MSSLYYSLYLVIPITYPPLNHCIVIRIIDLSFHLSLPSKDDFYNKPWGLKHWLQYADPKVPDGTAVALLDPDMIFVRPLTKQMRGQPNNVYNKHLYKTEADILDKVSLGHPVAQLYGLGAPWTNDNHKKFNRTYICGADSPCRDPRCVLFSSFIRPSFVFLVLVVHH